MLDIKTGTILNKYVVIGQISNCGKKSVFKAFIPSQGKENVDDKTQCYVIKAIPFETDEEKESFNIQSEILHLFVNVPNIVKYNEVFILKNELTGGKQFLFAVMDFCVYVDLFDFYSQFGNKKINPDQIRSIAFQTLTLLNIIHQRRVIHHDVKPANFLVHSLSPLVIKITDFEFSVHLTEGELSDQPAGTSWYKAPELLSCKPHDFGIDIWALGIMLYEFTAKKLPFNLNQSQPQQFIIRLKVEKNPLIFDNSFEDPNFVDLLSKMLAKDPAERITAEEALLHPYFENYNTDVQYAKQITRSYSQSVLEETDDNEKTDIVN